MKLDNNDHVNYLTTAPRKSYNPFDSDDETCDSTGLKSGNLFDPLAFEKNSDTISFHLDNDHFMWEEAMPTTRLPSSVIGQTPVHAKGDIDGSVLVKEGHVYTDKTVTECELPEVVVCYKERNNNQSVKDIVIDEGVVVVPPTRNKMWIRSSEESSKKDRSEFLDLDRLYFRSDADLKVESRSSVDGEVIDVNSFESDSTLPSNEYKKMSEDLKKVDDLNSHQFARGQYLVHEFGDGDDESLELSQLKLELENREVSSLPSGSSTTWDVSGAAGDSVKENPMLSDTAVLETPPESSRLTESSLKSQDRLGDATMEKKEVDDVSEDKSLDQITLSQEDLGMNDSLSEDRSLGHITFLQEDLGLKDSVSPNHSTLLHEDLGLKDSVSPNQSTLLHEDLGLKDSVSPNQSTLLQEDSRAKDSLPEEPSTTLSLQEEIKPEQSQFLEQESQISAHSPDHSTTHEEEESTEGCNQSKLAYNSKLESASITFDFGNTSQNTEKKEEGGKTQNIGFSKPPETQAMTRQEDEGTSAVAVASSSDNTFSSILERRVQGETSFSQVGCPPSSITFTGPVSYSGSISLRSESSAGSTRSFAFPVLQNEWNSSPVRMAKADQRNLKKQRGWVQAVICCKF